MTTAQPSIHSDRRLAALAASGLLDSPEEPAFDGLTHLVTTALRVPIALISLVDKDRQFFKSQCGLTGPVASRRETPLSHSLCQHVVNSAAPLDIADARKHPLVKDNLAVRDLGVVAYAGVPLIDEGGYVLGALCAIDDKPREWSSQDLDLLRAIAAQTMAEIVLRTRARMLAQDLERERKLETTRQSLARLNVHDLRTPLTALMMGMELLPRLGVMGETQRATLALCVRNGEALLELIDELLDISAIEHRGALALRRRACRPCDLATTALEQVKLLAKNKSIALSAEVPSSLPGVFADADKLIRVLVNLLGNAIKFTDEGGQVALIATVATVATVADGDDAGAFVRFSIRDTGIGIEEPERVFDEGVWLDPESITRRSTGLGLTFCKRTVEAHGGRIWLDTALGKGSTFHFTIPSMEPAV